MTPSFSPPAIYLGKVVIDFNPQVDEVKDLIRPPILMPYSSILPAVYFIHLEIIFAEIL